MKKILSVLFVAGMFAFFACGPSAADKAATEKRIADSIAADSTAKIEAAMAAEKLVADSIAAKQVADSIAAAAAKPAKKR